MKRKTILFISILQLLVITGCYDDLGNYGYTNSTKVSFVNSASSDYTFMVGDLFRGGCSRQLLNRHRKRRRTFSPSNGT